MWTKPYSHQSTLLDLSSTLTWLYYSFDILLDTWSMGGFQLFYDGGLYHIKTSSLICRTNRWTGFFMIRNSIIKEWKRCFIRDILLKLTHKNMFFYLPFPTPLRNRQVKVFCVISASCCFRHVWPVPAFCFLTCINHLTKNIVTTNNIVWKYGPKNSDFF